MAKINFDRVGRSLIWASLGLGLAQVLVPGRFQRMIGIRRGDYTGLIRAIGFRELASALLIFSQGRPLRGVWSRVFGDVMDLGLLGAAFTTPKVQKDRLAATTAAIAGITALDALTAAQITRTRAETGRISELSSSDLNKRAKNGAFHVRRSITINRSPEEVYSFWRNFEQLPRFMYHLESVRVVRDGETSGRERSHWVAKAPAGARVEWDAEITEDRPNELIAWRSVEGADVPNSGQVRFIPAPANRGTVVQVQIEYRPPGGAIGRTIAGLFGREPAQQVKGDLDRFKQVIETGEVVRSDGSPHGTGQKIQRPGRPMKDKEFYDKEQSKDWTRERERARVG